MPNSIICKLTGSVGPGIKAHIIPQGFYKRTSIGRFTISNNENSFPKKSHVGWYDSNIVTIEGEKLFQDLDNYAHSFLIEGHDNFSILERADSRFVLEKDLYDYRKLKLFFLSVLWRASVSTINAFDSVALGPHESKIREMIVSGNAGGDHDYSVILARFYNAPNGEYIMSPIRTRVQRRNCYRIYMGDYICTIKVDQRCFDEQLNHFSLSAHSSLKILAIDFDTSQERDLILMAANKNMKKFPPKFLRDAGML